MVNLLLPEVVSSLFIPSFRLAMGLKILSSAMALYKYLIWAFGTYRSGLTALSNLNMGLCLLPLCSIFVLHFFTFFVVVFLPQLKDL